MSIQQSAKPHIRLEPDNAKLLRLVQSVTHCRTSLAGLVNQAVEVYWSDYTLKRAKKNTINQRKNQ